MLVVDYVAMALFLAVEPVDAANRLEEIVVFHLLVDVEIGCGRRVKACQQLVNHDQQLHLRRMFDKLLLRPFLEIFGRLVAAHGKIHPVLVLGFRKLLAGERLGKAWLIAAVACNDGTFILERREHVAEHRPETICLVNRLANKHCIAPPFAQRRLDPHIHANVGDNTLYALFRRKEILHPRPALLQLFLLGGKKVLGFALED